MNEQKTETIRTKDAELVSVAAQITLAAVKSGQLNSDIKDVVNYFNALYDAFYASVSSEVKIPF